MDQVVVLEDTLIERVSSFTSGSLNAGRTNYVYAEDEYSVMSDGSEQATGMTYYSIY